MSVLFAQEPMKVWNEIPCAGIEQIDCSKMWAMRTGSNQYILTTDEYDTSYLYQFFGNGNKAVIKYPLMNSCNYNARSYFGNETTIYTPIVENGKNKIKIISIHSQYEWDYSYIYSGDESLFKNSGQCFLMNNNHYFLDYDIGNLYQLTLVENNNYAGTIESSKPWQLDYIPTEILSIVVLNDTLYYLKGINIRIGL